MELQVGERLTLLGILPKESNFITLKVLRGLVEQIGFGEEELKALSFVTKGEMIQWNRKADIPKDFPIGEKATDIIVESLKKLDEAKKLREEHFSLYEKFVNKNEKEK